MSRLFQAASAAAVGFTALTAILLTAPGMAEVRNDANTAIRPAEVIAEPLAAIDDDSVAGDPAQESTVADTEAAVDTAPVAAPTHASLIAAVAAADPGDGDDDLHCLAAGVYYEANGEPLEGQLAVAHVILNRMASGRFAPTACGVLTQRGQFSFVRGGGVPTPPAGHSWRTALAIARIARDGSWRNPAPGAMYFHAARVSPGWNRARVTQLGHHIFYR